AACLLAGRDDLAEARVAFLAPPGFHYVAIQWGIWRAGGIAIPLAVSHPPAELEYVIRDADAETVVVYEDFAAVMQGVHLPPATRTVTTDEAVGTAPRSLLPRVAAGRRAMIVYTSGTTGRPKGVVTTHENIAAQAARVRPASGCRGGGAARMRLMVSGSAALPVQRLERWREITGHVLLERYGMTEIGMALANPLHGERRPGFVGTPLPGVEVRLVDEAGRPVPAGTPGEIEVRGETVFL